MHKKIYKPREANHSSRGISDMEGSEAITEAVILRRPGHRMIGRFWMEA